MRAAESFLLLSQLRLSRHGESRESLVGVNWVSKRATLEIYCIDTAGP